MLGAAVPIAPLLLLAASFHIAVTLTFGITEIRIGLSDFVLLLVLPLLGWAMLRREMPLPLIPRGAFFWLGALTIWLTIALVHGRTAIGTWQSWAVLNKYLGWYVLLLYFVLGASVATVDVNKGHIVNTFLQIFIATASVISIAGFARVIGAQLGWRDIALLWNRQEGLLANPNAFGVAMAATWALLTTMGRERTIFSRRLDRTAAAIAVVAVGYSGSRSAQIALICAAGVLVLLGVTNWRRLSRTLGVALLIVAAIAVLRIEYVLWVLAILTAVLNRVLFAVRWLLAEGSWVFNLALQWVMSLLGYDLGPVSAPTVAAAPAAAIPTLPPLTRNIVPGLLSATESMSVGQRMSITVAAFEMWRASPLWGVGLGTFFHEQVAAGVKPPQLIHTSGLWLLTETGIFGVLLVGGFGLYSLWLLHNRPEPICRAMIGVITVFVIGSIGNELMYQRYFWFLLGLGLASARLYSAPASARRLR
ncbi:MAG TPA: O-antigen ligase family protein [Stellaceae bacterium]|nr:O-antigen ligase family protein [Stellaceae bacterium]